MVEFQERDIDRLLRILDYCDRIDDSVRRFGDALSSFQKDADYRDSVKMNLFQIGETVNTLSDDCKEQMGDIPWHRIYGMRNVIAHGYEKVVDERIWETVKNDLPELRQKITTSLEDKGIDTGL
ncbi:MAG: DUF86 domain-containing protein [Firmicutes bacterium]|nr:DUF86 domain-containing protein [Bacillota bacterium]